MSRGGSLSWRTRGSCCFRRTCTRIWRCSSRRRMKRVQVLPWRCAALDVDVDRVLPRGGCVRAAARGYELETPRFVLFPTYLHQNLAMLKPEAHGGFEPHSAEPAKVKLSAAG